MNKIEQIYQQLYCKYGPQGWWPLIDFDDVNPTKSACILGYHPADYSYPKTLDQQLEICLGSILTQNTSWSAVEKALILLKQHNALTISGLKKLSENKLKKCIKVAGYYNQKADYIKQFLDFFITLRNKTPKRDELLSLKGIGAETADSILLYAFRVPSFVIDTYTKRIFLDLGLINNKWKYRQIQALFENNLARDVVIYQEYHSLIVEHAKCRTKNNFILG